MIIPNKNNSLITSNGPHLNLPSCSPKIFLKLVCSNLDAFGWCFLNPFKSLFPLPLFFHYFFELFCLLKNQIIYPLEFSTVRIWLIASSKCHLIGNSFAWHTIQNIQYLNIQNDSQIPVPQDPNFPAWRRSLFPVYYFRDRFLFEFNHPTFIPATNDSWSFSLLRL